MNMTIDSASVPDPTKLPNEKEIQTDPPSRMPTINPDVNDKQSNSSPEKSEKKKKKSKATWNLKEGFILVGVALLGPPIGVIVGVVYVLVKLSSKSCYLMPLFM